MEFFFNKTRLPLLFPMPEIVIPWVNDTSFLGNDHGNQDICRHAKATGSGNGAELYHWRVGLFGFGGTVICCLGIICNIVVIIVLSRLKIKSSAPFLLMCLSVLDCIYLTSFLFLETLSTLSSAHKISWRYRDFVAPVYGYLYWVPLVCQTCTAYVVVVITLERFVLIVLPLQARVSGTIVSLRIAILSVCLCVAFSALYHIPDYLAFYHEKVWNQQTQRYISRIKRTEFGDGHFYQNIYFTWMNFTVNFLLPFALLLIFNGMTLISLYHSGVPGAIRVRQSHQKHLTIMIISMIAVFFVCELLAAVSFIFTAHLVNYHLTKIEINRLSAVADMFMLLKSACNFVIYCVTGTKFKQAFCELFCRCCQEHQNAVNGNSRPRDSMATAVTNLHTGRMRPLSSLSNSSGGLRIIAANGVPSCNDPRYRRSSSNASSGVDDGVKLVSGRLSSSGSSNNLYNHNNNSNHGRARVSLSTIAASDSCVDKSSVAIEMSPLMELKSGQDGQGSPSKYPQSPRDNLLDDNVFDN